MSGRKAVLMPRAKKAPAETEETKVTTEVTKPQAPKKAATKKAAPKKKATKKVADTPKVEEKVVEAPVVEQSEVAPVAKAETKPTEEKKVEVAEKKKAEVGEKKVETKSGVYEPNIDLKEMLETGAHFGHQARRWHPKMQPYLYGKRGGVHIFDLIKTADLLKQACLVAYQLGKDGKTLIFVGTKRQAREITKVEAQNAGAMYIINRWLGGFISNWEQVSKSIRRMVYIRKGLISGEFNHYTKKERVVLDKEAQRLERFFAGVSDLSKLPDALFVIDVGREKVAVQEANAHKIPVIALIDSNDDPTPIDYVIPANDDAVRSIQYFVHMISEAYKAGKESRK